MFVGTALWTLGPPPNVGAEVVELAIDQHLQGSDNEHGKVL